HRPHRGRPGSRRPLPPVRGQASPRASAATSGPILWQAAQRDAKAREKILGPLLRDIKISLRARASGELQRVILAGDLAAFPEIGHRFEMELNAPAGPLSLAPPHDGANGAEAPEMSL